MYTPLDLPYVNFQQEELDSLFDNFGHDHHPYPYLWRAFAVYGAINDFNNRTECYDAWLDRYNVNKNSRFNPHIPSNMLSRFKDAIFNLPYKKITFAQILNQKMSVAPHQDGIYTPTKNDFHKTIDHSNAKNAVYESLPDGFNNEPEPAGLKILLTHTKEESFFLSKKQKSNKVYIKLPDNTNSFAINERTWFHGAKKPKGKKYILSTFGIIDHEKHFQLIKTSKEKYQNYVIEF